MIFYVLTLFMILLSVIVLFWGINYSSDYNGEDFTLGLVMTGLGAICGAINLGLLILV